MLIIIILVSQFIHGCARFHVSNFLSLRSLHVLLRRSNIYSAASFSSLRSTESIHEELDRVNKDSVLNPFFRDTYEVKDELRGRNAVDLARSVNCSISCIQKTAVIDPNDLDVPYYGVDIEHIIQDITTTSQIDSSQVTDKYYLGVLRGTGGGKTRMIEETRIRMGLLYPNWLPIVITCDKFSFLNENDFKWNDPEMIIAYAICTRMIAAVYTLELEVAQTRMNMALAAVEKAKDNKDGFDTKAYAGDVIIGTVRHLAGRVKKDKPSVDSFVLFIDECSMLIYHEDFPPNYSVSYPNRNDYYDHFRETILGAEVGKELKTALVMASRSMSVFHSRSDRIIKPIALAAKLTVDQIVHGIWMSPSSVGPPIPESAIPALRLLASSINSVPCLVEEIGIALRSNGRSWNASISAVLSFYGSLYARFIPSEPFPAGKYLHALVNGIPIATDISILYRVQRSGFTNSITSFDQSLDSDKGEAIVLEAALSLLALEKVWNCEIKKEIDAIWKGLKDRILSDSGTAGSRALEDIFPRVLRMRLLSMHLKECNRGTTTLSELFAIDTKSIMCTIGGGPYDAATSRGEDSFEQGDGVLRNAEEWVAHTFEREMDSPVSARKIETLRKLLNQPIVLPEDIEIVSMAKSVSTPWKVDIASISFSFVMFEMPARFHCDLMLFLQTSQDHMAPATYSGDEMVVFIDWKSVDESTDTKVWHGHRWSKDDRPYHRYLQFCEAVATITEADLVGDRGYLRALMERRFLYVYVTTHPGPSVYLAAEDLDETKSQGVLVLSRDVTKDILGSTLFDVYDELTRSMMK